MRRIVKTPGPEVSMRRACLISLALIAASAGAYASDVGRAFEISDYYRIAYPSAPSVSPDGSRIAVSVRYYGLERGESRSVLWMMGAHGSRPRQMTFGSHHDTNPVFSPDGRSLLFVSDRDGSVDQLYLLPVDGGEARRLTDFPMGVSAPVWSPDGRWIAITSEVYPECGADADCNRTILEGRRDGPLTAFMSDELLYRHWNEWREGRFRHILLVDASTGKVKRDLTPGRWDSPTFSLGGDVGYDFSPDGSQLCYVSNHDPQPAVSTNSDLWLISVAPTATTQQATNVTAANHGWDGDPHFSPDGRHIAFRSQQAAAYESDLFRVAVYDIEQQKLRYLTDGRRFDDWASALEWSSDGTEILFQAEQKGRTPLMRIDLEGGEIDHVLTDGTFKGWVLTPNDAAVVYTRSTVGEPPEIYRSSLADGGRGPVRLSSFNVDIQAEVDIRPAEELWVKGAGDYEVQVFLVKPHDFDPTQKYPLILNVHGGPQFPWNDSFRGDWQVYPGKGYIVAFPNPTGSAGFGQEFVDAIACDWGGRVFKDLMLVADALADIEYVDADRMGAMGWSYGGYMMMWFEGHTDRFKAIASMMGVYDLRSMFGGTEELWFVEHDLCGRPWESDDYRKWSPSNFVKRFSMPCLVITGERDFRVPYTQSLQFFTDLQLMDVPSRLIVYPKAGHWPDWYEMAFYYLAHLDWFHQYLGGEPPPWDLEEFLNNQVFSRSGTLAAPLDSDSAE